MDDAIIADVHARIRQAFLLGLARQPLAVPPSLGTLVGRLAPERDPALALLALAGQRQRFVPLELPPADAVPEAARRLHTDPRPILPPPARRALARLTASVEKSHAGTVLPIAVRRIGEAGCRMHPFDLPALADHIKGEAESLGLAERAYLALTASDNQDDGAKSLFFERITADNWTTFPKASRRAFVMEIRRQDAAAGRGLIETTWKMEQAPMRAALLEALAIALGPDDKPFIDSIAGDRAESVRQTATYLLARIPATEAYDQRLAAAAACFKRPAKGMVAGLMSSMGLGNAVVFTPPEGATKDKKNWSEMQTVRQHLFAGLRIAELASAAGLTPDEIITALPADEQQVLLLLLDAGVADGDADAVRLIINQCLLSRRMLPGPLLMMFAGKARVTLAPAEAELLLAAPFWVDTIKTLREATTPAQLKDDGRLIFMAALLPRATMPAFVHALAGLNPGSTRAAKDFADLVLALPEIAPAIPT